MTPGCKLRIGLCGCHIRTTANIAIGHFFFSGFFAVCFVYTNTCYPPLFYIDHLFGGSGAALMSIVLIGCYFLHLSSLQPIRFILGFIITLNVLLMSVSTYYYTIERWNDVEVTALVGAFRSPLTSDFPDHFWFTLVVLSCINNFIIILYLPFFMSYMCYSQKYYLFMEMINASNSYPVSMQGTS